MRRHTCFHEYLATTFFHIAGKREGKKKQSRFIELLATYGDEADPPSIQFLRGDNFNLEGKKGKLFHFGIDRFLRIPVSWNNLSWGRLVSQDTENGTLFRPGILSLLRDLYALNFMERFILG